MRENLAIAMSPTRFTRRVSPWNVFQRDYFLRWPQVLGETEASPDDSGVYTMQTPLDLKILESQEGRLKYMINGVKEASKEWKSLSAEEKSYYQKQAAEEPVALRASTTQGANRITCLELRWGVLGF